MVSDRVSTVRTKPGGTRCPNATSRDRLAPLPPTRSGPTAGPDRSSRYEERTTGNLSEAIRFDRSLGFGNGDGPVPWGPVKRGAPFLLSMMLLVAPMAIHAGADGAAPTATVSITVATGPPTTVTKMSGSGYGASEIVDILFDATQVASATTDGLG